MASRDRRERRDGEDGPSESVNITALQTALVGAVSSVFSRLGSAAGFRNGPPQDAAASATSRRAGSGRTGDGEASSDSDDDFEPPRRPTTAPLPVRSLPTGFGKRVRAVQSSASKSLVECDGSIPIPRNQRARSMLATGGLIGKIHLESSMSQKDIWREIRSVFRTPMRLKKHFPFDIPHISGPPVLSQGKIPKCPFIYLHEMT